MNRLNAPVPQIAGSRQSRIDRLPPCFPAARVIH